MEIGILRHWVNINSGSTNLEGLSQMADALSEFMQNLPGTLERIPMKPIETIDGESHQAGDVLRLRFNPEAEVHVLLSGHMDTVYDINHPFQELRTLADGRLNGPGVADMKGGLYIMLEAVKQFLNRDNAKNIGGEILINADEELGSIASHQLLHEAAEWNHIGLVYESCLPGGELVRRRKGTGTFRLCCYGKAAHTGRDFENGRNAVAALSELLLKCHQLNGSIPETIINVANFSSPGPVNVVPDHAQAWLNIRIGHPDSIRQVRDALDSLIQQVMQSHPGVDIKIDGDFLRAPKQETPANEILHSIWNSVEQELGYPISGKRDTGGSSDGNVLGAAGLPHLDGVGIVGGAIHSDKEFALGQSIPAQINKSISFLSYLSQHSELLRTSTFSNI